MPQSFTLPDDGRSISRNVAHLNVLVHDVQTYCIMNTEQTSKNIFTYSRIVLKYIKNENQRFSAYIMHRVDEIKSNSNIADWYYVPGKMNMADQCTSPLTVCRFVKESSSYLNDPNMLRLSLKEHIANSNNLILSDTSFDIKLETECRVNRNNTTPVIELKRFSSWRKLVRHFAWIKILV